MIKKIRIFESTTHNPYDNLATEKYLMDSTAADECILYLWQNQNTVVIGQNQNAWAECRTSLLEEEGGKLARRLSGGGAVFHDLGNLNFTFLITKENYDLDRQLEVIRRACALAGIQAEKSGRNDLLAEGRKFSGNAFFQNKTHAYHHGTLLISVDVDRLQRYLSPPKAKLEAKGVQSVKSRVINLSELSPSLTCDKMKAYMVQAFEEVYGLKVSPVLLSDKDNDAIHEIADQYASWDYLYGTPMRSTISCQAHHSWGHLELQMEIKSGTIVSVKAYSDAMDWTLSQQIEKILNGCTFTYSAIEQAFRQSELEKDISDDILGLIKNQLAQL